MSRGNIAIHKEALTWNYPLTRTYPSFLQWNERRETPRPSSRPLSIIILRVTFLLLGLLLTQSPDVIIGLPVGRGAFPHFLFNPTLTPSSEALWFGSKIFVPDTHPVCLEVLFTVVLSEVLSLFTVSEVFYWSLFYCGFKTKSFFTVVLTHLVPRYLSSLTLPLSLHPSPARNFLSNHPCYMYWGHYLYGFRVWNGDILCSFIVLMWTWGM